MDLPDLFSPPLRVGLTKTLRIMRLTAIFIIAACLQSQAKGFSQTVTLSEKQAPLEKVLQDIKRQTGYNFLYDVVLLQQAAPVDLEVRNASLETVLEQCFANQPFSYTISGKVIVLSRKEPSKAEQFSGPPPIDIHGHVADSSGAALAGASVTVKATKKGTTTDSKGNFELRNVDENATIIISYSGFEPREFRLSNNPQLKSGGLSIVLKHSTSSLDEVQIIAYGTTTQRLTTGNIAMVKGEDIEKQPVQNPLLALQGRVPGLYITQSSGLPGSGVTVRIQGQNSINGGNDPLYVIDGVPYVSELLSTNLAGQLGSSGTNGINGNPLNYINPLDIESMEVLKDADATAIYGSRAANGAILITTKKGKAGKTRVDFNLQNGWGAVTRKLPLLNTPEYLEMRHEALMNDGILAPASTDYDINGVWDTTRYTDWQKVLLGGTALYNNYSGSVSGGNSTTQYLIGGTYHRETTVFPGSSNNTKESVHFNLNTTSTNQRLRVQFSGNYMFDNNQVPSTDLTYTALTLAPDAPALYKQDGTLNWQTLSTGASTWTNPLSYLNQPYASKSYNLVANSVLSYQILPGLEVRSNLGYTNLNSNESQRTLLSSYSPANQASLGINGRFAAYTYNTINSWIVEPQLEYKKSIANGKMDVLVGGTLTENNSSGLNLFGVGYASDALMLDANAASTVYASSTVKAQYKYDALFGRVNYILGDRYIIDINIRRDGSSRFGPNDQFHNFASAGIGWIFSEERFMKDNFRMLSFGKVRGSFGTTGNDQIGDYQFLDLYTSVSPPVAYQGVQGLAANNLPNPYLQWEETRKLQGGIELGFWQNRFLLTANYAYNRSSNELIGFILPVITGFTSINENLPATVQNTSAEFMLTTTNIKRRNFEWNTAINFTLPRNKLISYYGQLPGSLVIGKPLNITKVFHSIGVNPTTGAYYFLDSLGEATSSPNFPTDGTRLVNTVFPIWYGGFQNSFRFKQFHLDFLFQFVKHFAPNYLTAPLPPGYQLTNQPTYVLNRWQKPGDFTSTERYNSDLSLFTQWGDEQYNSDRGYSDASFVRLKNLSISYEFPEKTLRNARLQSLKIYMQGQNIFTISRFKGLDPETGNGSVPPLRVLTMGVQLGL